MLKVKNRIEDSIIDFFFLKEVLSTLNDLFSAINSCTLYWVHNSEPVSLVLYFSSRAEDRTYEESIVVDSYHLDNYYGRVGRPGRVDFNQYYFL